MQSASKRVRTIYSVIASSNRLEILRILNSKGPLSYSELKSLSGFKSKKESGKFAYHLRKLVRQMLVSLNRSERRYTVTSLGRLILNLTRQIEEQSVIESGKLFVRTSRHMMEEFNSNKILQSLIREAGMPVDLAQKMTSEAESRIYKFQTSYLTAPLIREVVNALLIEHGYEEYRHRLTRLGLPVYDITEMINNIARGSEGIESLSAQTSRAVFSEYLLLNQLPRDVTDAHLAGDIHISNVGSWGLKLDTVFVDLASLPSRGISFDGKLLDSPRISMPTRVSEALSSAVMLSSLLGREVSNEIALAHFLGYVSRYLSSTSEEELRDLLLQAFKMMSHTSSSDGTGPFISIHLSVPKDDSAEEESVETVRRAILDAYTSYISSVPIPRIRVVAAVDPGHSDLGYLATIASIIHQGGYVAVSAGRDSWNAFSGISSMIQRGSETGGVRILHSLSVNLPRLSYESNRDETYFRAKLALLLQTATSALAARRRIIEEITAKGLLPVLSKNSGVFSTETIPLIINLAGIGESIETITDSKASPSEKASIAGKIIDTALKTTTERGDELNAEFRIAAVAEDSGKRLATLDAEKYGKSMVSTHARRGGYSQAPMVRANDLLKDDILEELSVYSERLNGGCGMALSLDGLSLQQIAAVSSVANKRFNFFKYDHAVSVCRNCGLRFAGEVGRCRACSSTSILGIGTV